MPNEVEGEELKEPEPVSDDDDDDEVVILSTPPTASPFFSSSPFINHLHQRFLSGFLETMWKGVTNRSSHAASDRIALHHLFEQAGDQLMQYCKSDSVVRDTLLRLINSCAVPWPQRHYSVNAKSTSLFVVPDLATDTICLALIEKTKYIRKRAYEYLMRARKFILQMSRPSWFLPKYDDDGDRITQDLIMNFLYFFEASPRRISEFHVILQGLEQMHRKNRRLTSLLHNRVTQFVSYSNEIRFPGRAHPYQAIGPKGNHEDWIDIINRREVEQEEDNKKRALQAEAARQAKEEEERAKAEERAEKKRKAEERKAQREAASAAKAEAEEDREPEESKEVAQPKTKRRRGRPKKS